MVHMMLVILDHKNLIYNLINDKQCKEINHQMTSPKQRFWNIFCVKYIKCTIQKIIKKLKNYIYVYKWIINF